MSSAMPLVIRCVNSIIVCALALVPRTLPPQPGHLLPQPAPDPVARTKAPQSKTSHTRHPSSREPHGDTGIANNTYPRRDLIIACEIHKTPSAAWQCPK